MMGGLLWNPQSPHRSIKPVQPHYMPSIFINSRITDQFIC